MSIISPTNDLLLIVQAFSEALEENNTLQVLNMESNYISGPCIVDLLKAINKNKTLVEFRIANQVVLRITFLFGVRWWLFVWRERNKFCLGRWFFRAKDLFVFFTLEFSSTFSFVIIIYILLHEENNFKKQVWKNDQTTSFNHQLLVQPVSFHLLIMIYII